MKPTTMTTENQPARMGDDAVAKAFREAFTSNCSLEVGVALQRIHDRARELSAHGGDGCGALPVTLGPVAMEWYSLCERAPHAEQINITGELAAAIVKTITGGTGPLGGPIGWVFQHEETGRMTFCENDGINTPEVFARLNAGHILCGPAFSHSAATQQPASGEVVAIHQHRFLCQCPPHDQFCRCNTRWEDVNADYYQRYVKPNNSAEEWRIVYTTPAIAAHGGSGEGARFPTDCKWPAKPFTVRDEPGEHAPCWLVLPDGAMVAFNHYAVNGVDQARAKFIAAACNQFVVASASDAEVEAHVSLLRELRGDCDSNDVYAPALDTAIAALTRSPAAVGVDITSADFEAGFRAGMRFQDEHFGTTPQPTTRKKWYDEGTPVDESQAINAAKQAQP